jgi:hypothetical protein
MVKPFLPGFYLSGGGKGYVNAENSPCQTDKSAGVDSVGLLLGSVAMSSVKDKVVDFHNVRVGQIADQYFAMKTPTSAIVPWDDSGYTVSLGLLDSNGKPRYYPDPNHVIGSIR